MKKIRCEIYRDSMQNYKRYAIPKAQLIIADVPYNVGNDFYGSNPMWYKGGDNKNGESKLAGKSAFNSDFNFNLYEYFHFCSRMLKKEDHKKQKRGRSSDSPCMIVFCSFEQMPTLIDAGKKHGFVNYIPLVFIKNYSPQVLKANMRVVGATEYALVMYRGKLPKFRNGVQTDPETGKNIRGTGREVAEWFGVSTSFITNNHKNKTNICRPRHVTKKDEDMFFRLVVKEDTFESVMPEGNVYDYLENCDKKPANFIEFSQFPYIHKEDWFDIINLNQVNLYKGVTQKGLFVISVENHNGDLVNKVFFKSEEERDKKYKELKEFKAKKKYGKLRFGKYECDISDIVTIYHIADNTMFIVLKDGSEKKIRTKRTDIFEIIQKEFIR